VQFRQKALSKLQSPEELDLPVRFARPQGLLVLVVTVVVMVAASIWALTGSVSPTVSASGIITHGEGSYILRSPVAGQVTEVLAEEGARRRADAPLLKVLTQQGETIVGTPAAGRLTTLTASIGSIVTTGTDIAVVERVKYADDPLLAVLYLPARSASSVPVGASVDLAVESVPKQKYGVLRGRVKSVGHTSQTRQQISSFLGDSQLAEQFSAKGRPVAVVVQLDRASGTKSGYRWSQSDGPPYPIDSMTLASATVRLAAQRPIDWLFP
jgi:multidrug efflux pump subunit AcrA (membrane-fusion protein)